MDGPVRQALASPTPLAPSPSAEAVAAAAWAVFGLALLATLAWLAGPRTPLVLVLADPGAPRGLVFALRFDALTATLLLLVSFVGAVVVRHARTGLGGDPGQPRFMGWLALTLGSVLLLIAAGDLVTFGAAWVATSLSLHRLLVYHAHRPTAVLAARKKFLVSRLGDLCMAGAALLAWRSYGSVEFSALFAAADALRAADSPGYAVHAIALLLVGAALAKSAQLPFHGWLVQVMETPSPVSALLHAGIVNAGGFLIVRLSPLVSLSAPALDALALVGAATALFAGLVMLTQTSVKVSLAWSTIAQMGFMLLQCGLGSYASAVLHLVAHSLYKAHAFLSSGGVIELAKAAWVPAPRGRPRPVAYAALLTGAVVLVVGAGHALGVYASVQPGALVLGSILLMGVVHLVWTSAAGHAPARVVARAAVWGLLAAAGYFALQLAVHAALAGTVAADRSTHETFGLAIAVCVVLGFLAALVIQELLAFRAADPRWQAAYVHLHNGFYLNALADRAVAALWPARAATEAKR